MKREVLIGFFLGVIAWSSCWAAFRTPDSNQAYSYQPSAFEFGDTFEQARQTLLDQGYVTVEYVQNSNISTSPTVTLDQFAAGAGSTHGVWLQSSHGDIGGVEVEAYPHTLAGANARSSALTWYTGHGFSSSDLAYGEVPDVAWLLMLTPSGITRLTASYNTITFASNCYSMAFASNWRSRVFLGYNTAVDPSVA